MPRCDQNRVADRLVVDQNVVRARWRVAMLARNAGCLFRIPAEEFGSIRHFTARIGQRLSVCERDEMRKLVCMARPQLEPATKEFGALATWRCPPSGGRRL